MRPHIIGITGRKRSGKDTFATGLIRAFEARGVSAATMSFADPLRAALYAMDPHVPAFGSAYPLGRLQPLIDAYGWEGIKSTPYGPEVRRLLQRFGTDSIRALDDTFWVRAFKDSASGRRDVDYVIVPDVRFPNEAYAVSCMDGLNFRVTRPGLQADDPHSSETAMDDYPVDLHVDNTGTADDLATAASLAVAYLGLIRDHVAENKLTASPLTFI